MSDLCIFCLPDEELCLECFDDGVCYQREMAKVVEEFRRSEPEPMTKEEWGEVYGEDSE